MKEIFADASYWIALLNPRDEFHEVAIRVSRDLEEASIVTSEMVLVELLNHMSEYGPEMRRLVVETARHLDDDPRVDVVRQTSDQFWDAADYYASRLDKDWGITDCASFQLMESRDIWEVLSSDHDFEQAGFVILVNQD